MVMTNPFLILEFDTDRTVKIKPSNISDKRW